VRGKGSLDLRHWWISSAQMRVWVKQEQESSQVERSVIGDSRRYRVLYLDSGMVDGRLECEVEMQRV
jgi:hypothetical protein